MTKLLSNLPIEELTADTDYLGILDKGNLIKTFLNGNTDQFDQIKMFALYGDWGSGKSTLMKYLQKELDNDFNTFFFEAWEFEKDENLSMSLLEFITLKNNHGIEILCEEILNYGGRILRGLGKSFKFSVPLFANGPTMELDPSAFVEEVTKKGELSFYNAQKEFKTQFIKLEDFLTKGSKKFNIVFIDDLDRCEPEQVLNLLSAIKLFFTYGKKTIFFCGVDKKAVEEAVKTKYRDVVKSNEYLEKIFDISFSMPKYYDIQKLINHYFDNTKYDLDGGEIIPLNIKINGFFQELEFTNPRKIKKVLNKFQIFRNFIRMSPDTYNNFPNIDMKNNAQKNYFETILVLYLIILHEFYADDFNDFLNFEKKKDIYSKKIDAPDNFINLSKIIRDNNSMTPFSIISTRLSGNTYYLECFNICLGPIKVQKITRNAFQHGVFENIIVEKKHLDFLFYKMINRLKINFHLEKSKNQASFYSIKKLVSDLL